VDEVFGSFNAPFGFAFQILNELMLCQKMPVNDVATNLTLTVAEDVAEFEIKVVPKSRSEDGASKFSADIH
jgi:hypothetical protein